MEAVEYLLEKGADPAVMDSFGDHDAFGFAETEKKPKIIGVLEAWKAKEHGGKGENKG